MAQIVKNLPAMQETWVRFPGLERLNSIYFMNLELKKRDYFIKMIGRE